MAREKSDDSPADHARRPPRGRPRDPARLQAVLSAARMHFAEAGFEKGSMDGIAATAGVSKVTLYNYFGSKEALFNAIVNDPIQGTLELDAAALDPSDPSSSLLRIAQTYLELITSPQIVAHLRLLHGRAGAHPLLGAASLETGPKAVVDTLARLLRTAHAQGALHVPNADRAAEQFLAMVRGNEQIRLLLGQPVLRGGAARRNYCVSCVGIFVKAFSG